MIVIVLAEYLTSEEVGEPLGKHLAWPAKLLIDGSEAENKSTQNNRLPQENGQSKKTA